MENENLSRLEGKKVMNKSHAERAGGAPRTSASSTHVVSQDQQQRQALKTLKQVQGDFINNNAFTLIELLVVVLIIGILAAVALPQYQKAVLKAQSSNLLTVMEAMRKAEELYYLDNNTYTRKWNELDIGIISPAGWTIWIEEEMLYAFSSNYPGVSVFVGFENTSYVWKGKRVCYAAMDKPKANQFCQAMAGHTTPDNNNGPGTVNIYIIP